MRWYVALLATSISSLGLYAQHEAHQTGGAVQVLVDGSKNPELIEDRIAIKLFIISITEPPNATPDQLARLRAKIRRMRLNDQDTTALIGAVTASHNQLMQHKARVTELATQLLSSPDLQTKQQLAQLSGETEKHTLLTYSNILRSLSPDGAEKLIAHIGYIKTKTKIVPQPQM